MNEKRPRPGPSSAGRHSQGKEKKRQKVPLEGERVSLANLCANGVAFNFFHPCSLFVPQAAKLSTSSFTMILHSAEAIRRANFEHILQWKTKLSVLLGRIHLDPGMIMRFYLRCFAFVFATRWRREKSFVKLRLRAFRLLKLNAATLEIHRRLQVLVIPSINLKFDAQSSENRKHLLCLRERFFQILREISQMLIIAQELLPVY